MTYVLFDNRIPTASTFQIDASVSTYQYLVVDTLTQYMTCSKLWASIPEIQGICVAKSPDSVRLIKANSLNSHTLNATLKPTYTCSGMLSFCIQKLI